jgi:hypothetical protein
MNPRFLISSRREKKMNRKVSSRIMLTLLLMSALTMISERVAADDHDVAVTNVITFKTVSNATFTATLTPFDMIYQNYSVSINATVENHGGNSETFNVTAKYDSAVIQKITDVSLGSLANTTVTFTWNTTGVAKGNYTITVVAELDGDEEPGDNTYTYIPDVAVTWLGDQDGNFEVEADDLWYLCAYFITYYKPGPGYGYLDKSILFDFDENCIINESDLFKFSEGWINYYKST